MCVLNLQKNGNMATEQSSPVRLILPPDGKQTRIDFFRDKADRKHTMEWWHSLTTWFRHHDKQNEPKLEFFDLQLQKEGYSQKSRKSYLFMMKHFFEYYRDLDIREITMAEIEDYNFEFFVSGRYSRSYQLQFINALKLYFMLTQGVELNLKHLRKTGLARR
jgi:hypothetical protein